MLGLYYAGVIAVAGVLIWHGVRPWTKEWAPFVIARLYFLLPAGFLLWAMRPRRDVLDPPGPRIAEADQPRLFALIKQVAAACGQRVPDEIYATPDLLISAGHHGGLAWIGGRSYLALGVPMIWGLTVDEFRAVLMHEFAHLDRQSALISRLAAGSEATVMPGFLGSIVRVPTSEYAIGRMAAADDLAARLVAPGALRSGFERMLSLETTFEHFMISHVESALRAGLHPPLSAGFISYWHSCAPLDRDADAPRAVDLLQDVGQLETSVFLWEGEPLHGHEAVTWSETVPMVWVSLWRTMVERSRTALTGCAIEALPNREELVRRGRLLTDPMARLADDEELATRMGTAIAAAVCLQFVERGWDWPDAPNEVQEFHKGHLAVEPEREVIDPSERARAAWADFCARAGLSGPLV